MKRPKGFVHEGKRMLYIVIWDVDVPPVYSGYKKNERNLKKYLTKKDALDKVYQLESDSVKSKSGYPDIIKYSNIHIYQAEEITP